jgi:hypothetical protein
LAALLLAAGGPWHARAATDRFVAPGGTNTGNDCSAEGNPCATIVHAIAQADAGDTIRVAAGTYMEGGVFITKNVTIAGAGSRLSIVDGDGGSPFARVFIIDQDVTATLGG